MSVLSVADLRPGRKQRAQEASAPALRALPKLQRRRRGLLAGVILLLMAALAAVLTVNIYVANSQYQVVQMQNDHQSLVHENETLTQQVQFLESPQSLSNSAATLGMVLPASAGTLELSSSELVSSAEVASSDERPSSFVSAPQARDSEATAPIDVADQAAGAPSGLLGAGALHTLITPEAGQNGSGNELNPDTGSTADQPGGGTIPAPRLD